MGPSDQAQTTWIAARLFETPGENHDTREAPLLFRSNPTPAIAAALERGAAVCAIRRRPGAHKALLQFHSTPYSRHHCCARAQCGCLYYQEKTPRERGPAADPFYPRLQPSLTRASGARHGCLQYLGKTQRVRDPAAIPFQPPLPPSLPRASAVRVSVLPREDYGVHGSRGSRWLAQRCSHEAPFTPAGRP